MMGVGGMASALAPMLAAILRQEPAGAWTMGYCAVMTALGTLLVFAGLRGVVLVADARGISWRQFLLSRSIAWNEIEEIGIARSRVQDPADHRVARVIIGGRAPIRPRPSLGINLKLAGRNAATVAYRRGLSGFDIHIRGDFGLPLQRLVDLLQERAAASGDDR